MTKEKAFDDDKILTESGRKTIEFALQDESRSKQLFDVIRTEKSNQTKELKQLAIDSFKVTDVSEHQKDLMQTLFLFMSTTYKEIATVFDFIELTNKDNLQNRKDIESLAKIIRKNKNLAEDSTRVLINMINKIHDRNVGGEHINKQMQDFLDEYRSTLRFVKRKLEDDSRDTTIL